jgi:hypothetical protein
MLVRLGVHEQHPVLTRLLDHAHVQIVPLGPLLGRLCVSVDHAGEEWLRIVAAVARDEVKSPGGGNACNGGPEARLRANRVSAILQISLRQSGCIQWHRGGSEALDVLPWAH